MTVHDLQTQNDSLRAENSRLREALEPLAGQDCESWGCEHSREDDMVLCEPRQARAALSTPEPKGGE